MLPNYQRIKTFREDFDSYSKNAAFGAGQEHFYEGLREAGLPE
jgi:hypothetical protein